MKRLLSTALLLPLILLSACSTLQQIDVGDVLGSSDALDEATVAAGLKEALRVGTDRTVVRTNTVDGYLGDALLRIALPEDVQDIAGKLRQIGLGSKVDELEVAMNRAAEEAAGEATDLFVDAITSMTLEDAWGILKGTDTAATDYFHQKTAATLETRYRPIVETKLRSVGGYETYEELAASARALPFVETPDLDMVGYVTDRALEGLFTVLAQEEQRIREDPVARTTDLLQRVFAAQ